MELPDTRTLSPMEQDQIRIRAIHALIEGNLTQEQTAILFGVSRQSVNAWFRIYQEFGVDGLRSLPRGRHPGHTKLSPSQSEQITHMLMESPRDYGFSSGLWTRQIIRDLIEQRFDVTLGLSTVSEYLARWGFTRQKPLQRALERNPVMVQQWLDQDYPLIKERARREGAQIFWSDEVGFDSREHSGRTYGLKGHTPVVTDTGKRFSCSAILALTNEGEMRFMVYDETMTAQVFMRFLRRLVKFKDSEKVFLIVDRHAVHRSKKVKAWLAKHSKEIEMFYLPSYSPNLNPPEYVNNDLKNQSGVKKARIKDKPSLIKTVRTYLRQLQHQTQKLANFFFAPDVRYAASG
jgi:transposase